MFSLYDEIVKMLNKKIPMMIKLIDLSKQKYIVYMVFKLCFYEREKQHNRIFEKLENKC